MKTKLIKNLLVSILSFGITRAFSQGFINLNFEMANVPDVPTNQGAGPVSISLGMPGWTGTVEVAPDQIGHNITSAGGALIAIEGPAWPSTEIIQGNYTAYITGSYFGQPSSAFIAQTGIIPTLTKSIVFDTSLGADFQVMVGGQAIPLIQIGTGTNYVVMGGDVTAFAGQSEELRFTALPNVGGGFLDNIMFSTSPVPEPGTLALLAAGAVLLGLRWRQKA